MAQRTLKDGTSGDVVIRSGPPASGGGGGGSGGGGGGNRVGASGNFGGPSSRTKALRRAAIAADAERKAREKADAAAQVRMQTRQQLLAGFAARHDELRVDLDRSYASKADQSTPSIEQDITAAKGLPVAQPSERWQLYLITKEKNEIDGLIAQKAAQFASRNAAALAFDGHDPLTRTASDYRARLDQFGEALDSGHQRWAEAYAAAHEARLLSGQITALTQRSHALAGKHAEQTLVWREREAVWERHRQVAEQRDARIRFKQQADADARLERVKQANTVSLPATPAALSAAVLPSHPGEWLDAQKLTDAVARAIAASVVRSAVGNAQVAIFLAGVFYPTDELANGELTLEQRHRLYEGVAVPAYALDLHDRQEVRDAAQAGGSVQVEHTG